MQTEFSIMPERASSIAADVDALYFALIAISVFFAFIIFSLALFFFIRYRRKSANETGKPIHGNVPLELLWTGIPLIIALAIFGWGAKVYFSMHSPPPNALEVFVVGKQWMWKIQHPTGQREINELHVPVGRPVKLTMTSEDVIHSFFVPAFRIKRDVVPGRFSNTWFEATKTGEYHLFCAEYCGTQHSTMIGRVVAMEPAAYEDWLAGKSAEPPASAGEKLFVKLGCQTCHLADGSGRGPSLNGAYGKPVQLAGGQTVLVEEDYIRQSILQPQAKMVSGYEPIMPTFKGQVDEEGIMQLIAYIKTLEAPGNGGATEEATP